ncbi:hypothetical protein KAR02_06780 [Candidatus Bipolaricaulota bacterium]|nr:hypothetical protein [Candidatus Bipolaricaulota bacterium]
MADKFGIRVRCTECKAEKVLSSEEDNERDLMFDDKESALRYASSLGKKRAGSFQKLLKGEEDEQLHECEECQAVLRMRDLKPTVFLIE